MRAGLERPGARPAKALFGSGFARGFSRVWLGAGFLFLYLPICALVVFSFNDSPLPNVWNGFTLKWYAALASDREILAGLWLSLKIAFCTACGAVVLGTLAAFALVRYRRFAGRTLFSGMVSAPLVMPEVIIGLSLLLMLVSVQRATRRLRWASRARHADDLVRPPAARHGLRDGGGAGAAAGRSTRSSKRRRWTSARGPSAVFTLVTLPMIAQALLSAWLLTFTLSLDDVVLSAFLSGPGATTMPLVIFSRARLGLDPSVNAVATLIVAVVAIGTVDREPADRAQRAPARRRHGRRGTRRMTLPCAGRARRPRPVHTKCAPTPGAGGLQRKARARPCASGTQRACNAAMRAASARPFG